MHAWEAIQQTLDEIETNLPGEMRIETLAENAGLSPFYFQRLFTRLVGKPVNEYVRLRRLARASSLLMKGDRRIMDIALECGFSGHAGFTRAFTEAFGLSPEEYRENPVILNQFVQPDLRLMHAQIDEDQPYIADGMVLEVTRRSLDEPRHFIGTAHPIPVTELSEGRVTGIDAAGEMWQNFHRRKPDLAGLLAGGSELGVLAMGAGQEGCCVYLTAAECEANTNTEGRASFVLPRGEYVICRVEAESFDELVGAAIFKAISFLRVWMEQRRLICGSFTAELYPDSRPGENWLELWLPVASHTDASRPRRGKDWDKNDGTRRPSLETIDAFVDSPWWYRLRDHLEENYQSSPVLEFSKCSMQHGWNIKYKKSGRGLCTLYPLKGHFIVLVVIGAREQAEFEAQLPYFSQELRQLYDRTESGMGQKWLMIDVNGEAALEDVKQCVAIRRGSKKKIGGNN